VVVLLVLAAACSSDEPSEPRASPTPAGHVIAGTLALAHEGTGIAEGADVTVTDGGGDILALGALGPGTLDEAFPGGSDWDQYGPFGLACVFEFEVRRRPGQRLLRGRGITSRGAPLQQGRARSFRLVGGVLPRGVTGALGRPWPAAY
jgi:hypothetical protein